MAYIQDYLTMYRQFFEEFAATVNPDDQLPVKVAAYYLCETELVGEIVDWTLQYLNQKHCPSSLVAPITRFVIEEIKLACKKQPTACGYRPAENTYQPLKLMQVVTAKVNEICLRYRDNGKMATLPPPSPGPPISSCAIKNTRRRMEDRHVIIEDFHTVFNIQDRSPASYYAVFDGHAGTDAATYSVSHLHQFLAESSFYPTDPVRALKDAFFRTDALFVEKSNRENLRSGTTAVCALLRPKEKMLYVAWLGDSQALLVSRGQAVQVVNPHKPDREDERTRIEDMGGVVLYWGTWRVNGQLAVSRAIGDLEYKPYVTAEPDVKAIPLDGTEDFLIVACDGLWDFVTEHQALQAVYNQVREAPGDLESVSQTLVQLSKQQGSTDNISVIVVFLTEPAQLASRPALDPYLRVSSLNNGPNETSLDPQTMETSFDNSNNPTGGGSNPFLTTPNGPDPVSFQKGGLLLDGGFKQNGTSPSATDLYFLDRPNGKENSHHHHHYEDDDFGPETDVDAVDDVLLSPTKMAAERDSGAMKVEDEDEQKKRLEADLELQRQQMSDFDPVQERREETPTPPADDVPGVGNLVPEAENVAESGDDSEEDEWNYFRVDPTDHSAAGAEQQKQSDQPICPETAQPEQEQGEDLDDTMSQLNPNAAEFVPSPTQAVPTMNDILLAESPRKGVPMEDILIPSQNEFQEEVRLRPSEMDLETDMPTSPKAKAGENLPDLVNKEVAEKNIHNLENGAAFREFLEQQEISYQSKKDLFHTEHLDSKMSTVFDKSESSSARAEFGDDSAISFLTSGSEMQKTVTDNASTFSVMDKSFTEQEFPNSDLSSNVSKNDQTGYEDEKEMSNYSENEINEKGPYIQNDMIMNLDDMPPMSFEVHKEIVPEMESKPERVQLSEGTSSFEQDETSSPLQPEDTKFDDTIVTSSPSNFETEIYMSEQKHSTTSEQYEQHFFAESKTIEEENEPLSADVEDFDLMKVETMIFEQKKGVSVDEYGGENKDEHKGEMEFISENLSAERKEFDIIDTKKIESTDEHVLEEASEVNAEKVCVESSEFDLMNDKAEVNTFEAVDQTTSSVDEFGIEQTKASDSETEQLFAKLEELVLDEKLSPSENQDIAMGPLSPSLKISSPVPPDVCTATSTPETVPIGKESLPLAEESQSPVPPLLSPQPEMMSPSREVSSPVSLEDEMIVREGPLPVVECFGLSAIPSQVPESIVEEVEPVESDVSAVSEVMNKLESPFLAHIDAKSPEFVEVLAPQLQEAAVNDSSPIDEDLAVTHTPPPTPAHISEEALPVVSPEPQQLSEAAEKLAENVAEVEESTTYLVTTTAAAGALAFSLAAMTTDVKLTEEVKPKVEEKKEPAAEAKKATTKKTPITDKTKTLAKASPATKTSTAKAPSKTAVTSPTKPSAAAPRTSTPRKPATPTSASLRATPKAPTPSASKSKTASPAARSLPATTKSSSAPRPRPSSAATASKPLTNGEAKPAAKRAEPLATKKLATTTTTKPSRPASAPVAARTTTTTKMTTIASKPKPPATMNGTANKPRPAGALTTATARTKTVDKQVKETANKQISSNRTTTTTNASKTASTVTSRSVTATATKKTVGPVKSTMSSTTTSKTTSAGKVGVKKTGSTATTTSATRITATKSVNKTAASVTSTVSEVIQVQQIVTEAKN